MAPEVLDERPYGM